MATPTTEIELRLAIAELKLEMVERIDQLEIRLINRIHRLELTMIVQTAILLGAILAAAKYIH